MLDLSIYDAKNIKEVEGIFLNSQVRIVSDITSADEEARKYGHAVGIGFDMTRFENSIVKISNIYISGSGFLYFNIQDDDEEYNWNWHMVASLINQEPTIENDGENTITVKKGDLVKLRTKRANSSKIIGEKFGIRIENALPSSKSIFSSRKKFIVCDIVGDKILPYFFDGKYEEKPINVNDVEIVEENYIENTINHAEGIKIDDERLKAVEDIKLIEEMKLKVNEKDFRKIYAGSLAKIPKQLKGIQQVLHQWAFNKKEIYKKFGNQLSIKQQVECDVGESEIKQRRLELYYKFPGVCYVLDKINDKELLKNKLISGMYGETFCDYARKAYNEGDKVSKLVDEVFHNNDLNIELSKVIAQGKTTGTIEVSIDPIEYLLMSCNVSGWTSCHSIYKSGKNTYGCYSGGIFSYMCDNASLIAFRHDGKLKEYKFTNQKVEAYSKNWRQMIYLSPNMNFFITSREYPCDIDKVATTAREMIEHQLDGGDERTWVHSKEQSKIYLLITDNVPYHNALHYNDILHGREGDMCYLKESRDDLKTLIVGSNPVCPCCGEERLKNPSLPECNSCRRNNTGGEC